MPKTATDKNKSRNIFVLGDGGWGTALALQLLANGHRVTVWSKFPDYVAEMRAKRENFKYLAGVALPETLQFSTRQEDVAAGFDFMVMAVPTQFIRGVMEAFEFYPLHVPIVSVAKGIENKTLLRPTQILRELLGPKAGLAVLSGPTHAEEVARGVPSSAVAASADEKLAKLAQQLFNSRTFRIYTNNDLTGVELGGALKNVIAIAAGVGDGLGFGDNSKSSLVTRGLAEMSRIGVAMGGRHATFSGLSGMGDLITTCFSRHGRNRRVGERLGKGEKIDDILASTPMVAEGVWTAKSLHSLARKLKVEMPISVEVYDILFAGKAPKDAVVNLMSRKTKSEVDRG